MPRELKATYTRVVIHPADQYYDCEGAIEATLVDEGGGSFFEIRELRACCEPGEVRIELDELLLLVEACKTMMDQCAASQKDDATS